MSAYTVAKLSQLKGILENSVQENVKLLITERNVKRRLFNFFFQLLFYSFLQVQTLINQKAIELPGKEALV
ncbi:hypothetical protein DU86_08560 [Methanosarcina mazei]|uniref:Uncharacterized protein n=1 Tax=Methanosarcina mazei TaxID=2209 RepID=A0A0F8QEW1_METMZ|nr:hypothetical protein DU31_07970 [Methanosarcina mazei]KKH39383.1 hypothetical protein DU50_06765 [Methanosarcina mazei]KKH51298.1 hypothetical protein DU85_08960 [Methanosarcina mazei]KKH53116.1 hypothetical protein DU76_10685 [Methanosarcina mazei]KKH64085.1 hypothetical protein DU73_09850 [Methanosarcina mazei]